MNRFKLDVQMRTLEGQKFSSPPSSFGLTIVGGRVQQDFIKKVTSNTSYQLFHQRTIFNITADIL